MNPSEASRGVPQTLQQAVICDGHPERQAGYRAVLEELGYWVRPCGDQREALGALRGEGGEALCKPLSATAMAGRQGPGLFLLHERFAPPPPALPGEAAPRLALLEEHPILQALNNLPGRARRQLCVGVIGADLRTLDPMLAFCLSVNFVVAERDLQQLRSVLLRALGDHQAFYGPLIAALEKPTPARRSADPAR